MARDWDKLAGERGEDIPAGRLDRMWRMGKLGASVGVKTALRRAGGLFSRASAEERAVGDRAFVQRQAQDVTQVLGKMKGAAMKLGQLLSTDPDMVPPEFAEALVSLQKEAPPMTWRTVKKQVEDNFDRPIDAVYSWFDPDSVGSASIGQVHRARLHDGRDVAVKIQYPGVTHSLDSDLKNVKAAMTFGKVIVESKRMDEYFEEIRRALVDECDYRIEAQNLHDYSALLSERPNVRVPTPYPEWTTREVLTMEFVEGQKLDEALAAMDEGPAKTELCRRFVDTYSWMLHDRYQLHCDPHPGNFILDTEGNLTFLDFGAVKSTEVTFTDGILDILDACWQRDDKRAADIYRELGFGREGKALFDPKVLREYHEIVLEPLIHDVDFAFADWDMNRRLNAFVMKNPVFLKWHPPAEGLMIFRVMGGIKGLMVKVGAEFNVHRMAVDTAERAGRLTGRPKDWT